MSRIGLLGGSDHSVQTPDVGDTEPEEGEGPEDECKICHALRCTPERLSIGSGLDGFLSLVIRCLTGP